MYDITRTPNTTPIQTSSSGGATNVQNTVTEIIQLCSQLPAAQANQLVNNLPDWLRPLVQQGIAKNNSTSTTPLPSPHPIDLPKPTNAPKDFDDLLTKYSVTDVLGMFGQKSTGNQQTDSQTLTSYATMMYMAQNSWDNNTKSFKNNGFTDLLKLKKLMTEMKNMGLSDTYIKQVISNNSSGGKQLVDSGMIDGLLKMDMGSFFEGMGSIYNKTKNNNDDALGNRALTLGLQLGVLDDDTSSQTPSTPSRPGWGWGTPICNQQHVVYPYLPSIYNTSNGNFNNGNSSNTASGGSTYAQMLMMGRMMSTMSGSGMF